MKPPEALKCLEALVPGRRLAVIVKQQSYDLPVIPVEPPPPPNPLAPIEEVVGAVREALFVVQQGQEAIVQELRKPVIPKYDELGKLVSAQREYVPGQWVAPPVIPPPKPLATVEEAVEAVKDALVVVQQGQEAIVLELRKPVVPKYDERGQLIAAQRE